MITTRPALAIARCSTAISSLERIGIVPVAHLGDGLSDRDRILAHSALSKARGTLFKLEITQALFLALLKSRHALVRTVRSLGVLGQSNPTWTYF